MTHYEHEISLEILFKALSSTTRIDILQLLSEGGMCVNAISERLDLSQSLTSQNLRVLRNADIVSFEKEGKHIHYFINPNAIDALRAFLMSLCKGHCHAKNMGDGCDC